MGKQYRYKNFGAWQNFEHSDMINLSLSNESI